MLMAEVPLFVNKSLGASRLAANSFSKASHCFPFPSHRERKTLSTACDSSWPSEFEKSVNHNLANIARVAVRWGTSGFQGR